MQKFSLLTYFISVFILLSVSPVRSQINVDLETGVRFNGYNDVRIPGEGGTLFSLTDELEPDPGAFYRIRFIYNFNDRHHLGALLAPLSFKSTGRLNRDLRFTGDTFPSGTPLEGTYKFNSYRLFYRYDILRKEKLDLGLGLTAKIRDAKIAVEGGGIEAEKTDLGFVPLIHFRLFWQFAGPYAVLLEGDALAAPQGRAEDILAALTRNISDRLDLKLGYRLLEGGADNEEVYSFALIHYVTVGAVISL